MIFSIRKAFAILDESETGLSCPPQEKTTIVEKRRFGFFLLCVFSALGIWAYF